MKSGKLYLIPCTISESDPQLTIPKSVFDRVPLIQFFLVENIRTARRYISALQLGLDISSLNFEVLDKKTNPAQLDQLLKPLKEGKDVGVISESGCPGVADPGSLAVAWAHKNNVEVIPLTGPSSILLALMSSGFNGQKFCFHGYLPIQNNERKKALHQLEKESSAENQTQIFIETPYRNMKLFESIIKSCQNTTLLCIAYDITGSSQLIKTQSIVNWKKDVPKLEKLPAIFLLYSGVFH